MLTVTEVKRSKMSHFLMTEFAIYFSTTKNIGIERSLFGGYSSKGSTEDPVFIYSGKLVFN